jgi:S-DNA-T family DNA segregation ATPase FtsK/SpoIIIE
MIRPPSPEYLEFQSDQIERVLASHRLPVRVSGGAVTPRWIRYHFTPAPRARIASVRHLTEDLALALGAPDVRLGRDGTTLTLDVARPEAGVSTVRLRQLLRNLPTLPPFTAVLGLAQDGRPLLLRLSSPDIAHVLIAGTTGAGKTELMRTLLLSLAHSQRRSQLQLALMDPKGRGLRPLASLPHCLTPVLADAGDILFWLKRLVAEMERRDREGQTAPRVVIAIDELSDLLLLMNRTEIEPLLTRLAQRGREAGLHLVAGTQKPSSAVLGSLLKANFPTRLVGRVTSADEARVASGIAGSGAEKLLGRGDFLAVACGQVTRFQAAWAELDDRKRP